MKCTTRFCRKFLILVANSSMFEIFHTISMNDKHLFFCLGEDELDTDLVSLYAKAGCVRKP